MYVSFYLVKHNFQELYSYDSVNLIDIDYHKFPSGKRRKCLTFVLDNGNTITFPFVDVVGLSVENYKGERHPYYDDSKVIFVEDGQPFEKW